RHCMALVSKHVPFGGGGGHCKVQIWFAASHGCVVSHSWSVHCLVMVSKHFCSGPSGGHSCTHVWPASRQGWVREHVCGPHRPALRSKQVPLGGGAAQRSEQNSFGCAHGVDGPQGSA